MFILIIALLLLLVMSAPSLVNSTFIDLSDPSPWDNSSFGMTIPSLKNTSPIGVVDKFSQSDRAYKKKCGVTHTFSFDGLYPLVLRAAVYSAKQGLYRIKYTFRAHGYAYIGTVPQVGFFIDDSIPIHHGLKSVGWEFSYYSDWETLMDAVQPRGFTATYSDNTTFTYAWNCTGIPNCKTIYLPDPGPDC